MACNCGSNRKIRQNWVVTKGDGTQMVVSSESEASQIALRTGGSYRRS